MDRVPVNAPAKLLKRGADGDDVASAPHSWLNDHKFALGSLIAVATLGSGLWWRRRRRRRIELGPMSDQWLREREYDAGQRSDE